MKIRVKMWTGYSIDMINNSIYPSAAIIRFVLLAAVVFSLLSCKSAEREPVSIIEIIDVEHSLSKSDIDRVIKEFGISPSSLYNWENHWVIFTTSEKGDLFKSVIDRSLSDVKVKQYDQPFYEFYIDKNCDKKAVADWEHIIMTANLVNDELLQTEYMEYHRTQFEEWPEVSAGFCNAEFQQLLVFRNDRQLMLVISIPKGKTLDELNPKTTENNPRVDEWNSIMGKYQEGIEDAPDDAVWVEFINTP